MEQLYNAMMASIQIPQSASVPQKGDAAQKDGFQKLLEQKADPKTAPKQEKADTTQNSQNTQTAQSGEKPQEADQPQEVQAVQEDPKELEKQMALAAMAMLQNPVVPAEQVVTPEVQAEAVVDEAAPLMAEDVLTPEAQSFVPETEKAVEIPVDGGEAQTQTADQAPVEELPQTIEAPKAAQETESRTVEVKAETGNRTKEAADSAEDTPELQDAEVGEAPVFEDVKAVPVKVGETPKAEMKQPVEEQISHRLTEALQNGETHVEIQLTPENLGKVTVEMTLSKDGGLVVQLHAENRETQSLLSKNSAGLEALLGRETAQEVRVEVPRQEESQRQDLYEQQQQQHRQHQQEQQRRRQETSSEDFIQQLRLGLIPLDGE